MSTPSTLLDEEAIRRALARIAHEILESNKGPKGVVLIGILDRGDVLAQRIAGLIEKIEGTGIPVGAVDISFYRDDLKTGGASRVARQTDIAFGLDDKVVVLVDDVLFTGRSVRAALDAITDFGRPRLVQLAVLVDRGHRELPISADFVGKSLPTSQEQTIEVRIKPTDNEDIVRMTERA